jgi:uncharacterized membrane protein YeaQ/YmgE (transglycosylase-associated protein family)
LTRGCGPLPAIKPGAKVSDIKPGENAVMLVQYGIIATLVIGLIAGWLAGKIMGGGFGLIGDIVIGIIGAVVGGWLWMKIPLPEIGPPLLTTIISAVVGACILLFLIRLVKR